MSKYSTWPFYLFIGFPGCDLNKVYILFCDLRTPYLPPDALEICRRIAFTTTYYLHHHGPRLRRVPLDGGAAMHSNRRLSPSSLSSGEQVVSQLFEAAALAALTSPVPRRARDLRILTPRTRHMYGSNMKFTRDLNLDHGFFFFPPLTEVGVGARVRNHVTSAFQVVDSRHPIKYFCLND